MKFNQPAYPTVYFSENICVKCPKCTEPALVNSQPRKYSIPFPLNHQSKCTCGYCGFHQSGNDQWAGYLQGFVNQSCGHCGTKVFHSTEPTKKPYPNTKVTCETCQQTRAYEIAWYRYRGDKPTDPYFGFDLWLQTDVKDNVLWLYNLEHLTYLRDYVSAKLREDNGRHKYSMITNLPQWMKSSKNRDLIVKKLNKLEEEFIKKID